MVGAEQQQEEVTVLCTQAHKNTGLLLTLMIALFSLWDEEFAKLNLRIVSSYISVNGTVQCGKTLLMVVGELTFLSNGKSVFNATFFLLQYKCINAV